MELADFILEEELTILFQEGIKLPAHIKSALEFYVTEGTDNRVLAFSALKYLVPRHSLVKLNSKPV